MDIKNLEYAARQYGTPLYVLDTDEMRRTANDFHRQLGRDIRLCFAMKANPFLAAQMAEVTDRIEVCSMGEFRICQSLQVPSGKLFISGVLKKEEDLREILNTCGAACSYTAESPAQLAQLSFWAEANTRMLPVYLRLTSGNQFGMDERIVRKILAGREAFPCLDIRGIHYFSGTQKKSVEKIKKELLWLDGFLCSLDGEEKGKIRELEYGPGLAVPYFEGQKDSRGEDLPEIRKTIDNFRWNGSVTLEMGRALTASCGYYLTRVRDVKQNGGKNYCIVDGGIHQLNYDGQIRGMYRPPVRRLPERERQGEGSWTVCGSLCTVNDVLVQSLPLGELRPDDVLIFEQAGAYAMTEGMALFLSHELPGVVTYSRQTGWKRLRREIPAYQWNMEEKEHG